MANSNELPQQEFFEEVAKRFGYSFSVVDSHGLFAKNGKNIFMIHSSEKGSFNFNDLLERFDGTKLYSAYAVSSVEQALNAENRRAYRRLFLSNLQKRFRFWSRFEVDIGTSYVKIHVARTPIYLTVEFEDTILSTGKAIITEEKDFTVVNKIETTSDIETFAYIREWTEHFS